MRMLIALAAFAFIAAPTLAATPIDQDGWAARKKTVTLENGQKLAIVEYGDPKGKPVLLLHGFTDTSRSWTQLLPALAEFRVVIPDQRGHGAAAAPECCYAPADYAYDLKLLMDELEIDRAAIAGHSMGSMVAMEFAAANPDRVEKLVLAGSTGKAPTTRGDWMAEGALAMQDPIAPDNQFVNEWFSVDGVVETPVDRNFLEHVFREGRAMPAQVWRGVIRALTDLKVARHARDIKAPVLIIAGGKDTLLDAEHQAALRAAFPQAQYVAFERLGHNMIWEEPGKVAPPLVEFLRK